MNDHGAARDIAGAISEAAVRLAHTAMPRGSLTATTTFSDDSVTVVIRGLDDGTQDRLFAPSPDEVERLRAGLHRVMREDLVTNVEGQLGRRVLAFIEQSGSGRDRVHYMYLLAPAGSPSAA